MGLTIAFRGASKSIHEVVDGPGLRVDHVIAQRRLAFLIGGPDGLSPACRARAERSWSLGRLTLPHPLVRIVLVEQLYRAWTILNNHPYHRG